MVFLGPRASAKLVPKFHVTLHASHAALPIVTLKILPYTNITMTFDFGLHHPLNPFASDLNALLGAVKSDLNSLPEWM
jgi:hypothetical protein